MHTPFIVACGDGVSDKKPANVEFDSTDLFEQFLLLPPRELLGLTEADRGSIRFKAEKSKLPYMVGGPTDLVPEPGRGGWRGSNNFHTTNVLILDIDEIDDTGFAEVTSGTGTLGGLRYVYHTTVSATPEKPKCRIYFRLLHPIPGAQQARLYMALKEILDWGEHLVVDPGSKGCAHIMFGPARIRDAFFEAAVVNPDGGYLDATTILESLPEEEPAEPVQPQKVAPTMATGGTGAPQGDDLDSQWQSIMVAAGAVLTQSPRRATELTTNCPFHDDTNPSLDITPEGKMLCRAGCTAPGGEPITWLRYVAKVRGCDIPDATRFARSVVGGGKKPQTLADKWWEEDTQGEEPGEQPKEKKANRYAFVTIAKLNDPELQRSDLLWGDWFVKSCLTSLIADGGIGKSTVMRSWAKATAHGLPFLGRPTAVGGGGRIAFLDFETGAKIRKRKIEDVFGDDLEDFPGVLYAAEPPMLGGIEDILELDAALTEAACDAMVLDTVSAGLDIENENDAKDVLKWLNNMRALARRHDMAVILIHHPGKNSASARGSTAWKNSVDVELMFDTVTQGKMPEGGYPADTVFRIHCTKSRIGDMGRVTFVRSGGTFRLEDDFGGQGEPEDTAEMRWKAIYDYLAKSAKGVTLGGLCFFLEGRPGCSRSSVSHTLTAMVVQGIVEKDGLTYRLTQEAMGNGQDVLV